MIGAGPGRSKAPPPAGRIPGGGPVPARYADAVVLGGLLGAGILVSAGALVGAAAGESAAEAVPWRVPVVHRVDLDAAGEAELQLLPGVGPRLAERIAAERAAGGPFGSAEEVERRVAGVGPARVGWWKGLVRDRERGER